MISLAPTVTGEDVYLGDLSFTEEERQRMVDIARSAGQGLTLSGSDEAEAIIRSLIGDKSYSENVDQIRSSIKKFDEENPKASTAAYLGGIIPTLAMSIPALATRLGIATGSAALGALEGLLTGEGLQSKIDQGALGGIFGGIGGKYLPKLFEVAAPKVKGFLTSLKEKITGAKLPEPRNEQEAMAKRVVEITSNARREGRNELTDAEFAEVEGLYERGGREGGEKDFTNYIRNNSDLPMDKASRSQRMMEQGFEGPYYKGRKPDRRDADKNPIFSNVLRAKDQHMSEDPSLAASYGGNFGTVEELAVRPQLDNSGRTKEPLYIDVEGANFNQIPLDTNVRFQKNKFDDTPDSLSNTFENNDPYFYERGGIDSFQAPSDELINSGVTTTDLILRQLEKSRPYLTNQDVVFENIVDRGATHSSPQSRNIIEAEKTSGNPDPMGYKGSINRAVVGAPERIRRTSANFDPLLKNIKNLNAAMAAGIPLGALGFFADNEEYYQDM
jgi:hypothetical protein